MPKNKNRPASTLRHWGERGLINWILPRLNRQPARSLFRVPPGDDAAVLSFPKNHALSIDGLVDGTHFRMSWESSLKRMGFSLARALGWKLLGSSLSDLASMGNVERPWAMIYVGAPPELPQNFLKEFFLGLEESARKYNCALAGGDTVRSRTLNLVSAVGGTVKGPRVLTRTGSRPGDLLAIAGNVGDAGMGLRILEGNYRLKPASSQYFVEQFFNVTPLFKVGRDLSARPGVTALLDLSDSLSESFELLLDSQKLGFEIDLDQIPRSSEFRKLKLKRSQIFSGGEDYGFLFSADPSAASRLKKMKSVRIIGRVAGKGSPRLYKWQGKVIPPPSPFHHFS